jgi:MFS family permease
MGIGMLGFLFNDLVFIAVAKFSQNIPGGYWNLILGPIVEGFLGGFTACLAAFYAYIADTTTPGGRSHVYSLALGLVFTGMALGPSIGSLMIGATGHVLSVFYMTTVVHFLFLLYVFFLMPESVTKEEMFAARGRYNALRPSSTENRLFGSLKRALSFLAPLSVFLPPITSPGLSYKKCKRDWNLTFIAGVYAFTILLMVQCLAFLV